MSRLEQAGDSSTVSPGCAKRAAALHRFLHRGDARGVADAGERGLDEPGVAAQQHGGAHLAAECLRQRREVLALAIAAGDHHQRTGEAADRGQRGADVGALGIVDVAHAVEVRDPLRAMRQARELAQLFEHRRDRQAQRVAERQRRQRVGRVVPPGDLAAPTVAAAHRRGAPATASFAPGGVIRRKSELVDPAG